MSKKTNNRSQREIASLVTYTNPHSVISEEFNTLRTNIQFAMANRALHTLMVTSAKKSEGKTTISSNMAVAFANQGKNVLLVDSDLRKPSLHLLFHLSNRTGLTNVLTDKDFHYSSFIHPTPHENLWVLPSGPIPPNPSELIDSKRMEDVIAQMKMDFHLIIFDMPPIIAVTDAQVMAAKVDGTVFVIRSGVTEKKQVLKAKELLEYAKATVVGAVLNDQKLKRKEKRDYYGYHY